MAIIPQHIPLNYTSKVGHDKQFTLSQNRCVFLFTVLFFHVVQVGEQVVHNDSEKLLYSNMLSEAFILLSFRVY